MVFVFAGIARSITKGLAAPAACGILSAMHESQSRGGGDDAFIPGYLGARFSKEVNILPELIAELWEERERAKVEDNRALAHAVKIIMNSFYGVLGSSGCRFFSPQLASSITRRGHEIIGRSRDFIEERGLTVLYGDTDSLFVLLDPQLDAGSAKRAGGELAAALNQYWRDTLREEYGIASHLEVEQESLFERFLMPAVRGAAKGSKKRYAGTVRGADGAAGLVIKGLESVRTDWTPLARTFQKELLRRVFADEPFAGYIKETCARLAQGELDGQLVYAKRLRRPLAQYHKNVPPHVQAARKMKNPGRTVRYVMTAAGPEPVDGRAIKPDYAHYMEKQLKPAADGILHFLGTGFEQVTEEQLSIF